MDTKEEVKCTSKEKLSSFKINWDIPRSILQLLNDQKDGSIKSSQYKSKFFNSSWYLKLECEENKAKVCIKLYLREADIEESMIWASTKTIFFYKRGNEQEEEEEGAEEFIKSWKNNLHQTGMTVKGGVHNRFWALFEYFSITCNVELKAVVNNITIKSTPRLPASNTNDKVVEEEVTTVPQAKPTESQKTNNASLLESGRFSDVTFKVGTKTFKAHRAILVVQSEYFDTMFNSGLHESNELVTIDVTDVEPEIFEALLKYLYTKETPLNLDIVARDLLAVADKYLVRELVEICEDRLCKTIDHGNCVELLIFADMYNCKKLREDAVSFIQPRLKQILKTDAWSQLMKECTPLALEVFDKAI